MAQTAQINIKVDEKQAQGSVNNLNKSLQQTETTTSSLRAQLRQVTQELQGLEPGSKRFNELSQRAGQLRDTIQDTNAVIKATAGSAVENLGSAFGKMAGIGINAFQGIAGVQAMLGSDSEELIKLMAKLQGAMAVGEAIKGFGGLKDTFVEVKAALGAAVASMFGLTAAQEGNAVATGVNVVATEGQIIATEGATVAQGILNAVMAANPVMLLVVGVGALIAAFTIFGDTEESVEDQTKRLNKELEASNGSIERLTNRTLAYQKLAAGLEAHKSTITQINLDNELIKAEDKLTDIRRRTPNDYGAIKQAIKEVADVNKKKADADLTHSLALKKQADDELWAQKELTKEKIANIEEFLQTSTDAEQKLGKRNELKDLELELTVLTNQWGDTYRMVEEANAVHSNKMLQITTEMNNQLAEETKRANDEQLRKRDEYNKKLTEYYDKLEADRIASITEGREKELQEAATNFDEMAGLADEANVSDAVAKENYRIKLREINDKWDKVDRDKELEIENQKKLDAIQTKIFNEEAAKNLALLDADTNEERLKIEKVYGDSLRQLKIDEVNTQKEIDLTNTKLTEEERQKIIAKSEKDISDIRITGMQDIATVIDVTLQMQAEKMSEFLNVWGGKLTEMTSAINQLFAQQTQQQIDMVNARYQTESDKLQAQFDQKLLSEEEFNAQQKAMEQQRTQDEIALKRKQFNRDKANNIVNAIMLGAQSVLSALATMPPASYIMAAINAGLAGVQIATISQQQFKAARGGIVPGNGNGSVDSVPSMLAPGEAVINSNSAAMFPNTLSLINQAGGGISLAPEMPTQGSSGSGTVFADNRSNQPVKAYVVETEITSSQKRVNRIERSVEF
jgi:hypothetical protein